MYAQQEVSNTLLYMYLAVLLNSIEKITGGEQHNIHFLLIRNDILLLAESG